MKFYMHLLSLFVFFVINLSFCHTRNVKELFDSMEIEDKCGQMTQITLVNFTIYYYRHQKI